MPSIKQTDFIRSLVGERLRALSCETVEEAIERLQVERLDSKQASSVIDSLLKIERDAVEATPATAAEIEAVDALDAVIENLPERDREFASSLVSQYRSRGRLSDRQWPHVHRLAAKGQNPVVEVEVGMYRHPDGQIVRVYVTQTGNVATKTLVIESGKGRLDYTGQAPLAALKPEHRLTEVEAAQVGRTHGFCVACLRHLDEDRSIAAGYGPTCAKTNGWRYPSAAEAASILNRLTPRSAIVDPTLPTVEPRCPFGDDERRRFHPNTAWND